MDEKANRVYKDNVFRLLFKDESNAVELYNAINGTNYAADAVKMNMLESALFYGKLRNDISFTVDDRWIILIEHQSSVNPNMGLRCLLYVADIYKQMIETDELYKANLMSIANPDFVMLYNGQAPFPEKAVIKLSDLFIVKDGREPNLEAVVTVYNVNKGYNSDIMAHSKTLDGYAAFIAKVREYQNSGLESTESLQKSVEYCIKNGILDEFLKKNGGEIVNLLNFEWNMDDALRVRGEEGAETRAEKIAKKMLKRGTSIEIIIEDTELTEKRILELKKELKI